jgi:HSP20 family protein
MPDGWLVKLELAGVHPDDVQVATRGNMLWVQGTRRDARVQECLDCHRLEIEYSRFERLLELPGLSESAEFGVSYRDGMLLIRIQTESHR